MKPALKKVYQERLNKIYSLLVHSFDNCVTLFDHLLKIDMATAKR